MITVRLIKSDDEIAWFASIGTDLNHRSQVQEYVRNMLEIGSMRLDWCLVAEKQGEPLGRIAFWTLPKMERPLDFVLLELPWENDRQDAVGSALLRDAAIQARAMGVDMLGYCVDTPPSAPHWHTNYENRIAFLERSGFTIARETYRFNLKNPKPQLSESSPLRFRTLSEVGELAYIEAIMRVTQGTFDSRIREGLQRHGSEAEARSMFTDLANMEYNPEWWQLAYDTSDELVGLVMPSKSPVFATIGYIGVVPEKRGNGYIDVLLQQGTSILAHAGEMHIRADTDTANFPMANAFIRAGYDRFAMRREYTWNFNA